MHLDLTTAGLRQALSGDLPPENGCFPLAPQVGQGYWQAIELGPHLRLLRWQLTLHQELVLTRRAEPDRQVLTFSFRHLLAVPGPTAQLATVQVMSAGLDLELRLPAHTPVNTLLLIADAALFAQLPAHETGQALLQALLASRQPLVYEELLSPAMRAVAAALVAAELPPGLRAYYQRVKAEELLCLFLAELARRPTHGAPYPLRSPDVRQLYQVRDHLLRDLSQPPSLPALARAAGWSESKLKRLFRQVFGLPVYQYYQAARLEEAARRLRTAHLSVAEVGYQLGFQNLSHFTRLFARHTGTRPKQFSKQHAPERGREK